MRSSQPRSSSMNAAQSRSRWRSIEEARRRRRSRQAGRRRSQPAADHSPESIAWQAGNQPGISAPNDSFCQAGRQQPSAIALLRQRGSSLQLRCRAKSLPRLARMRSDVLTRCALGLFAFSLIQARLFLCRALENLRQAKLSRLRPSSSLAGDATRSIAQGV